VRWTLQFHPGDVELHIPGCSSACHTLLVGDAPCCALTLCGASVIQGQRTHI